ncbi:hypothetical protein [Microvirga thermotolerans]|uniref:Uncharacterized protein n=1 Tax=Microvirga thermotolerans TaxID=2651334 RepID=A0A5P9K0K5_9HYPH|nr:hypothetical protein [Microvirga thermotolerans]QFU15754.1 hypothetical protein GDR74_05700 [Microvirga thermotolerans]
MRYLFMSTIAAAALALSAGAMAQTPVPNASGSQTTSPETYGATAKQPQMGQQRMTQPQMKRQPVKKRHVTRSHRPVTTTGSVHRYEGPRRTPVPNASGSQVTAPDTYRANAYQNRR